MRKVYLEEKVLKLAVNTAVGLFKSLKKLKLNDIALHCKLINVRDKSYNFVALDAESIVFGLEIYTLKDSNTVPLATLFFLNDFIATSEYPLFGVYMYNANYELEQVFKSTYAQRETFTSDYYVTGILGELNFLLEYKLFDRNKDTFDWNDEAFLYTKCTLKVLVSYCKYISTLALPNKHPFRLELISAIEYINSFKVCVVIESDVLLTLKLKTSDYFNGAVSFVYKQHSDLYCVYMHSDVCGVLDYHRIFNCDEPDYTHYFLNSVMENLCRTTTERFHTHFIKED